MIDFRIEAAYREDAPGGVHYFATIRFYDPESGAHWRYGNTKLSKGAFKLDWFKNYTGNDLDELIGWLEDLITETLSRGEV